MDLSTKRCGCGAIWRPASMLSRETRCVACLRKAAVAAMDARKHETSRMYDPATEYAAAIYVKGGHADPALRDPCAVGVAKPSPRPAKPAAVDPMRDAIPAPPKTLEEARAMMAQGWWLQLDTGARRRTRNGVEQYHFAPNAPGAPLEPGWLASPHISAGYDRGDWLAIRPEPGQ